MNPCNGLHVDVDHVKDVTFPGLLDAEYKNMLKEYEEYRRGGYPKIEYPRNIKGE